MAIGLSASQQKQIIRNYLKNSDFNTWTAGAAAAPDSWTASGSGTIARSTTIKGGLYSFSGVVTSGNTVTLSQTIHGELAIAYFQSRSIIFRVWVKVNTASRVRIRIDDGVSTNNSSYHTGSNNWELLEVSRTIDAAATKVDCVILLENDVSGYTAYVDLCAAGEIADSSYHHNNEAPNGLSLVKSATGNNADSRQLIFYHDTGGSDKKKVIQSDGANDSIQILASNGTTKLTEIYESGIIDFPNQSAARAYLAGAQNLTASTWTKILLDTESYDLRGEFASNKFTATKAGYYLVIGNVSIQSTDDNAITGASIYKNGSQYSQSFFGTGGTGGTGANICDLIQLNATDYVELYGYNSSATDKALYTSSDKTWMSIIKVI